MARRSGNVLRGGRLRRQTEWIGGTPVRSTLAAANTAVLQTTLSAGVLNLRPFTVIRTVGALSLRSDQAAVSEDFAAMYGICVVSDQAVAIGVTAVPTPSTDNESDLWYLHRYIVGRFNFLSSVGFHPQEGIYMEFESRAARKVEEGQDVIDVVESPANVTSGCTITTFNRTLIKLH